MENEDIPTVRRPISQEPADNTATIQVPVDHPDLATPAPADPQVAELAETIVPAAPQSVEVAPEPVVPATATPAVVAPTPATPAASPYMSVEDLLALQIAGDPQGSPDGTLIAFTVLCCSADTNTTSSAIWLVDSKGGKAATARQVTGGASHDTAPRWSPDGQTLAFLSDRTGTPQIYLLPMNGGEARRLSMLPQGVSEYSWRPDGAILLAHSAWKPSDDQAITDTTTTAIIYTRLDQQRDGIGYKHARHQQLWLLALDGTATRLTSEPVDLLQSCWSPDGTEIAFCANRRSDPDLSLSKAVWVLTIATGGLRRLTPVEGWAQMPAWAPDGQSIAYLYMTDQTEASNIVPCIVSAHADEAPQVAIEDLGELTSQAWIIDELHIDYLTPPQWYPDSLGFLMIGQKRGQVHLYRIDKAQKQVIQLTSGNGRYMSPHLSRNGQTVTMIRADWFTPGDIWVMDSDGKNVRKLTGVNDAFLRNHQLIRPRRVTWHSADATEIEGWLYLPPLPDNAKAPLVLAVHGGPSLAWGDSYVHEFQVLAGRGYAVLAPNPRGSAGYGEKFSKNVLNDWGGDDYQDVMAGVDHVIATEPVDETRLGIGGMSYGGYMTNWAITRTNRFKAAVSRNGMSYLPNLSVLSDQGLWFDLSVDDEELQSTRSALPFADRITAALLLLHAENDLGCPFSESMQLFVALRKRKHTVQLVRYPNASHLMDWPQVGTPQQRVDRLRRTVEWYEHFLLQ